MNKYMLWLGLFIAAGCAVAGVVIYQHTTALPTVEVLRPPDANPKPAETPAPTPAPTVAPKVAVVTPAPTPAASQPTETPAPVAAANAGKKAAQPQNGKGRATGYQPPTGPIGEAEGRTALAFVGADPQAEKVWMQAINDPSLPANARQNLIEDLNEDGLSDPKNPTADDLPLIESRLALIEQIGDNAADDVNYAAFQEAYKDLISMRNKLTGN